VRSVYLDNPVAVMYVNGTAQDLVRDIQGGIMLAVSEQQSGKVMGFADENSLWDQAINQADNMLLANNMIDWLSMPILAEHDLKAELTVPSSVELGKETSINFTVRNNGLNDETGISLYLFIDGNLVRSESIAELQTGESYNANYVWKTSEPSICNFTAYTSPVTGEENIANNIATVLDRVYYVRSYISSQPLSGGTAMSWHADDASWPLTLPFDFPFYGTSYRTIYISSNGLITFVGPDVDSWNSVSALSHKLAVAAAWFNWATYYPCDIYVWTNGTYIGIRWNVVSLSLGAICNFEAVLSSEGIIQLNFGPTSNLVTATVGISDGAENMLAEEMLNIDKANTIVFMPSLGKRDVAITNVVASTPKVQVGDPVGITVTVENKGNFTENFYLTTFAIQQDSSTTSSMQSTRIYLDPQQCLYSGSSVSIGYRFNITARVEDVSDLLTWQIGLYFNGSILKVNRWFEPTWDPQYVFFNQPTVIGSDIGNNYLLAGASLLDPKQSFNGSGELCIIEFEITAIPQAGMEPYSSALIINDSDTLLLDSNSNEMPVTKQNGYYEIQPAPIPGHYPLGTVLVLTLLPGEKRDLNFTWNTVGAMLGDYVINAEASVVPCENETLENIYYDGIVTVISGVTLIHDVAVIDVTGLPSFAYQGWILKINVSVANLGNATESFTVTLYYNSTVIATQPVLSLDPNSTSVLTFDWNTITVPSNQTCTIKALASTVQGEMNTTNNELVAGEMRIKTMGDVNGDGLVNMRDVSLAIIAFRSYPGRANWNPEADVHHDNLVDMRDLTMIVLNFYRTG
jgi:hypothetical protein